MRCFRPGPEICFLPDILKCSTCIVRFKSIFWWNDPLYRFTILSAYRLVIKFWATSTTWCLVSCSLSGKVMRCSCRENCSSELFKRPAHCVSLSVQLGGPHAKKMSSKGQDNGVVVAIVSGPNVHNHPLSKAP